MNDKLTFFSVKATVPFDKLPVEANKNHWQFPRDATFERHIAARVLCAPSSPTSVRARTSAVGTLQSRLIAPLLDSGNPGISVGLWLCQGVTSFQLADRGAE